jgi:hypothetical protein
MNARVVVAGKIAVGDRVSRAESEEAGLDGSLPGQDRLSCAPRADLPALRR